MSATVTLEGVSLNPNLVWDDEHAWSPVAQSVRPTLDGGLAVFHATLAAGRPITLKSTQDTGWLTKTQVDAIAALADTPGGVFTLDIRGVARQVMFRHQDAPAFEAAPLIPRPNPASTDWYLATLKLMQL